MKAHKYWSIGALACMCMACVTGFHMKSKEVHKYWAFGAMGCMLMAMYSGYRMVHRSKKKSSVEKTDDE